MKRQLLFVHGGGEGAYEEDRKMAASLRDALGGGYEVRCPKMPDEDSPRYAYPEVLAGMEQMDPAAEEPMKQTPMYQLYSSVAPRPEDWPVLLTKLGELLGQDYDWSEEAAAIEVPAMIVVGDADSVRTSHAVAFFELLGGGKQDAGWDGSGMSDARLAILPGTTHYGIFSSPALAATVSPFLDTPGL
jgi:pimeloyl-ACP methyl ester carboxylesterase